MADISTYLSESFRSSIDSAISKLEAIDREYKEVLDTLSTKTTKIAISNWNDRVQETLDTQIDDFKFKVSEVDDDIRNGNFVILRNKFNELQSEAEALRKNHEAFNRRSNDLSNAQGNESYSEAQVNKIQSAVNSAQMLMDNNVEMINILISEINSIEFNGQFTEQEKPMPIIEPVDAEDYGVVEEDPNVIVEDIDLDEIETETVEEPQVQKTSSFEPSPSNPIFDDNLKGFLTIGGFIDYMPVGQKASCEIGGVPGCTVYKVGPDAYTLEMPNGYRWSVVGSLDASASITNLDRDSVTGYGDPYGLSNETKATWDRYAGKMQQDNYK